MAAFAFSSPFPICSSLPRTTTTPSSSSPLYLSAYGDAESAATTTTRPAFLGGVSRRHALLSLSISSLTLSIAGFSSAAILEADDDEELLEKVKRDRKKRLEKQGVINSSKNETAYLQELVYKLSKVGQAIDNNDLSAAGAVLGPNTESDWVKNISAAFDKLSSSSEEKSLVDTFNASLASLISSGRQFIKDSVRVISYGLRKVDLLDRLGGATERTIKNRSFWSRYSARRFSNKHSAR